MTRRFPPRTPLSAAVAVSVAGLLLATLSGCVGASSSPSSTASSSRPTSSPSATPGSLGTPDPSAVPFGGEQGDVPSAADIKNVPDLRKTVAMTGCQAARGGWEAVGTAATGSDESAQLQLVVIFTDAQARSITSSTITVPIAAGATASWTAAAKFTPPEGVQCVLAGVGYAG